MREENCGICAPGLLRKHITVHDDVIKWKHFQRYWSFVWGIHRSPVNFPHKGQWRGALMFPFICAWTDGWVNNRDAGDLKRHRTHDDVTIMTNGDEDHWCENTAFHVDVMALECIPHYRSPTDSPHKGQKCMPLMLLLLLAWIYSRIAGDLRHHAACRSNVYTYIYIYIYKHDQV